MHEQEPVTQTMKISDVKNQLSSLVNRVYRKETRVLVEKSGIPVAALVSAQDLELLARLDAERAERRRIVEAMREPCRDVPPEELEREGERAIAEMRARKRAERERAEAAATSA
jgi:prevent-host-death family protein